MSNEIKVMKESQDNLEQYGRRECLEVRGIPQVPGEDTNGIIINMASKVGVDLEREDISISHRLPIKRGSSNANNPGIIVKFTRRTIRDKLYLARFKLKNITSKELGFTRSNPSKLFIVESLTKPRKELFKLCLQAKKDHHYRYCWTSYGKILMRKDESSPSIEISNPQQLERL